MKLLIHRVLTVLLAVYVLTAPAVAAFAADDPPAAAGAATALMPTDVQSLADTLAKIDGLPAAAPMTVTAEGDLPPWLVSLFHKYPWVGLVLSSLFAFMFTMRTASEALLWLSKITQNADLGKIGSLIAVICDYMAVIFAKLGYAYPKALIAKKAAEAAPPSPAEAPKI